MVEATDLLESCSARAKGYLLAAFHTGSDPSPSIAGTLSGISGQPMAEAFAILSSLPPEQRGALAERWHREEPARVDDWVDLHWTWLVEPLEKEPFPLALLLLRELRPGLAKETAKALAVKKPAGGEGLDLKRLPAPLAAHLRRSLFSRFLRGGGAPGEPAEGGALLSLSRRELYLLLQDVGTVEVIRVAGHQSHDLLRRLRGFREKDREETVKLLTAFGKAAEEAGPEGEEAAGKGGAGAAAGRSLACVEEALAGASDGEDVVGLTGLSRIALALADRPRDAALSVARKMLRPWGERLLAWRDRYFEAGAEGGGEASREVADRIMKIRERTEGSRNERSPD